MHIFYEYIWKMVYSFSTVYRRKHGFSTVSRIKIKKRNRLEVSSDARIAIMINDFSLSFVPLIACATEINGHICEKYCCSCVIEGWGAILGKQSKNVGKHRIRFFLLHRRRQTLMLGRIWRRHHNFLLTATTEQQCPDGLVERMSDQSIEHVGIVQRE